MLELLYLDCFPQGPTSLTPNAHHSLAWKGCKHIKGVVCINSHNLSIHVLNFILTSHSILTYFQNKGEGFVSFTKLSLERLSHSNFIFQINIVVDNPINITWEEVLVILREFNARYNSLLGIRKEYLHCAIRD